VIVLSIEFNLETNTLVPDHRSKIFFKRTDISKQVETAIVIWKKGEPNKVVLVLNPNSIKTSLKKTKVTRLEAEENPNAIKQILSAVLGT